MIKYREGQAKDNYLGVLRDCHTRLRVQIEVPSLDSETLDDARVFLDDWPDETYDIVKVVM